MDRLAQTITVALQGKSGPALARLFHRLLAVIFLIAWLSLGEQVQTLIGSRGLLPIGEFLETARGEFGFVDFPTFMWWASSDTALNLGVLLGVALAVMAFFGLMPRACMGVSTLLYLCYATGCRTFLSFQWDNLLLECGVLATFLPRDRHGGWVHALFRLLLFKLYFESGLAKWQSQLGDWQDGSAMTFYYETAPLPTWVGWFAHQLPVWWHHFESWAVLVLELVVPFLFFGPRRTRLLALLLLSGFQLANIATANYGFFCHLTLALHLFLLEEHDVVRFFAWVRRVGARLSPALAVSAGMPVSSDPSGPISVWLGRVVCALFLFVSTNEAMLHFVDSQWAPALQSVRGLYTNWRFINTYHLFGSITRDRIEPEFQTDDGEGWAAHDFLYKPGSVEIAPSFVAPHQPRVDFQLWFHGLSMRTVPAYVATLLNRLCSDPEAVQALFDDPLPLVPKRVRVVYWQYHFSSNEEWRNTGAWWKRAVFAERRPLDCHRAP